jgi:L-ascorbate metabolism protein UlaG (beta-lactamase superfamily)
MDRITSVRTSVLVIGGSTAVLQIGGLRLITDPTFDQPAPSVDGMPRRTSPPAVAAADVGHLDAVLLSHDQHPDNLDDAGRALLATVPLVATTPLAATRLGITAAGLAPYEHVEVQGPDGPVRITGLPAEHGPAGAEAESGPVTGFLVSGEGLSTVYVSGDNASLNVVRDIADRVGPVDVALLFVGAAKVAQLHGGAPLTLDGDQAADAAAILGARTVVPLHCEGWTHYSEGPDQVAAAFDRHGLQDVLSVVPAGHEVDV